MVSRKDTSAEAPRWIVLRGHAFHRYDWSKANASVDRLLASVDLEEEKAKLIAQACDDIIAGKLDDNFPLVVWQLRLTPAVCGRSPRTVLGTHYSWPTGRSPSSFARG